MVIKNLTIEAIKLVDKNKVHTIELDANIECNDILNQLPYYVRTVVYTGSNKEIISALLKQYPDVEGFTYKRYVDAIDLDITTVCNLSCNNCIKLSNFKSTWFTMSVQDVENFAKQNAGKKLTVKILGGEPTLHKDIDEIISILYSYNFNIILLTNGLTGFVPKLPIAIENSSKTKGITPEFHTTMVAPKDLDIFNNVEYSYGCSYADNCGYGYKDGKYYGCTNGPHLNRLLTQNNILEDLGKNSIDEAKKFRPQFFEKLCQYCGLFKKAGYHNVDKSLFARSTEQEFSKSWEFMTGVK